MRRICRGTVALFLLAGSFLAPTRQQANKPRPSQVYTMPEYNDYVGAQSTKDPAQQVKQLDDFVSKYPNSALLVYVYPLYWQAYAKLKNYSKVIEYAEKLLALGDHADAKARYGAIFAWANAYNSLNPSDVAQAAKAKELALTGIRLSANLEKPSGMEETRFKAEKKDGAIYLYATAGAAALATKDYAAAGEFFKALQSIDPYDPVPFLEWRGPMSF